jgi:hypothetical protein
MKEKAEYSTLEYVRIWVKCWLFSTMIMFAILLVFAAFDFTPMKKIESNGTKKYLFSDIIVLSFVVGTDF